MRGVIVAIILMGGLVLTKQVRAECWTGLPSNGPDVSPPESCETINEDPWKSTGTTKYACSTDYNPYDGKTRCYWHPFKCTTPCGESSTPGGGGGGNTYLTCPAGTTVSMSATYNATVSTKYYGTCNQYFPSLFTPILENGEVVNGICQISGLCCAPGETPVCNGTSRNSTSFQCNSGEMAVDTWYGDPDGDGRSSWYPVCMSGCSCAPTTPPCDDTPPTNLSVSNITTNTATISWTPGTGGASQLIRVDEDLAEVQNGSLRERFLSQFTASFNMRRMLAMYAIDSLEETVCSKSRDKRR